MFCASLYIRNSSLLYTIGHDGLKTPYSNQNIPLHLPTHVCIQAHVASWWQRCALNQNWLCDVPASQYDDNWWRQTWY